MLDTEDVQTDSDASKRHQDILDVARKRFKTALDAESHIRQRALEDLRFSNGEHWDSEVKNARQLEGRPCLTIDRLNPSIHQLTNDQRQNRPAVKVSPVDDKADPETAKIYQGIIRHIEYSSDADTAYDTAFESAVRASFGFWRITTEYCDPMSFDQEIRIKRKLNRFSCILDPNYQNPDGSDAEWGFDFEDISHEEFKSLYPKAKIADSNMWESIGDQMPEWATSNTVRVADYFYKEYKKTKVFQLSDGSVLTKDELDEIIKNGALPTEIQVLQQREVQIPTIKWCKITGADVLEETVWPGKWIPIVPVLGQELDIDGKRVLRSLTRSAMDPQRMYDYMASAEAETIALAPKAPYIGVEGQFEGHEAQWRLANRQNLAFLQYKPIDVSGQPAPPPQRNVFEPPIAAISQARMMASEDLKATTGIYDAALGARSNESSGIAIQRRSAQAQTANFHFIDNLSKSIRHTGRILVDLIPHIYDTERAVRILGEDGNEEIVMINKEFEHKGQTRKYQLDVGKYDVTVSTGPSFETKRQEAVQSIIDLTKAYPNMVAIAGDLLVRNMDWPGSQEIADRLKKTLPPGLADSEGKQEVPPEIQAQMSQMGTMIDQLTQQLNEAKDQIQNKTIELESKERIEMAKIQANIEIEMAKMGSQEAQLLLKTEVAEIQRRLDLLNYQIPITTETNGAGPEGAAMPIEPNQTPTGGPPPGTFIGE